MPIPVLLYASRRYQVCFRTNFVVARYPDLSGPTESETKRERRVMVMANMPMVMVVTMVFVAMVMSVTMSLGSLRSSERHCYDEKPCKNFAHDFLLCCCLNVLSACLFIILWIIHWVPSSCFEHPICSVLLMQGRIYLATLLFVGRFRY